MLNDSWEGQNPPRVVVPLEEEEEEEEEEEYFNAVCFRTRELSGAVRSRQDRGSQAGDTWSFASRKWWFCYGHCLHRTLGFKLQHSWKQMDYIPSVAANHHEFRNRAANGGVLLMSVLYYYTWQQNRRLRHALPPYDASSNELIFCACGLCIWATVNQRNARI